MLESTLQFNEFVVHRQSSAEGYLIVNRFSLLIRLLRASVVFIVDFNETSPSFVYD